MRQQPLSDTDSDQHPLIRLGRQHGGSWQALMKALARQGAGEIAAALADAQQLLRENGVNYNAYVDLDSHPRQLQLDPVPQLIEPEEWQQLEQGLIQRAELLNWILKDLYGPQTLLANALIPPELLFHHTGFLRQCMDVPSPDGYHLVNYAAKVVKGNEGKWWLLADITRSPAGNGYALETRVALSRSFPELYQGFNIRRVASFFAYERESLAALAHNDRPHVVLLSPGPSHESYFEQAYLAAYQGYTLVQGDDLTVREGFLWLRTVEGLKKVDVVLRCVGDDYCDPLELRSDSRLGVAGLLEVARRGNVVIANPIGSSLLEHQGLNPFLPRICKAVFGEPLKLPQVASWWCGHKEERSYVLEHLDKLVVKTPWSNQGALWGPFLSEMDRHKLKERILRAPHNFIGQEIVDCQPQPGWQQQRPVERRHVMRTFLVAGAQGYRCFPGGLTLAGRLAGSRQITAQRNALNKDTWVLAGTEPESVFHSRLQYRRTHRTRSDGVISSRVGENLFWLGRYATRTEELARWLQQVLLVYSQRQLLSSTYPPAALDKLLVATTHITETYPGFGRDPRPETDKELLRLLTDRQLPGSLPYNLNAFNRSAYHDRNLWSAGSWRIIDDLSHITERLSTEQRLSQHISSQLDKLLTDIAAFSGLINDSMMQHDAWRFLNIGRRLERAVHQCTLLRALFLTPDDERSETLLLESALFSMESLIAYRRLYRNELTLEGASELLLLDVRNPRSLLFQLTQLEQLVSELPRQRDFQLDSEEQLTLSLRCRLQLTDADRLAKVKQGERRVLGTLLSGLQNQLYELSDVLSRRYFVHVPASHQLTTFGPEV